jgi:DNA polymerase-1
MRTLKGEPTGAVYGFVTRVESLLNELRPTRIVVAFDSRGKTHRHEVYPEYKAKRLDPPEELLQQIPWIKEYLEYRGIPLYERQGIEADDIIAKLAVDYRDAGDEVYIFSADKDLFQLVGGGVQVFHPKLKQKLGAEGIEEFFGVSPVQIVDYLALVGDSSDNIPGVPGIGEKTALKLMDKFGSVEEMLRRIDEVEERYKKKITANMELLELSRKLVDLGNLPDFALPGKPQPFAEGVNEDLLSFFGRMSFSSLLKKFDAPLLTQKKTEKLDADYVVVKSREQLLELKDKIKKEKYFAFDLETTALEFFKGEIVGVSISFRTGGFYIPFLLPQEDQEGLEVTFDDFEKELGPLFADPAIGKSGHNLKFDILHLKWHGVETAGTADDSMLQSYLIFPNRRAHNLKELTKEFLDYKQVEYDDLTGKGRDRILLSQVPLAKVSRYCIDDSLLALRLTDTLKKQIEEEGLSDLYRDIEIPLIKVLTEMEFTGVRIDKGFLSEAAGRLSQHIQEIVGEIYTSAGYQFNINSSQQLGELLFEKMNLPVKKRTRKTRSYSTDNEVLQELKSFPVVEKVIEYRTLKKLLSTYLEGLLESVDDSDRVHTSFNQTVTATGRLSSSHPNLQNIPVGEMGGVNVRQAFIPSEGNRMLTADYSQIELRVMAHFSKDPNLMEAFRNDFDIHQHTADRVFGKDLFLSPQEMRKRAKIINFSVLYGSGPYSLSKELGVSYKEAANFIDMYFDKYSGVRDFIGRVIGEAEQSREVKTILGRKREIPEIVSSNRTVKENGNRMAINTTIQGSAADIIKVAMVNIHKKLKAMDSKLIMQVHDELVFDYPPSEEERLLELVRTEMEHAIPLDVPLKVTIKKGENWGEMESV